jgi:hypothetical protein
MKSIAFSGFSIANAASLDHLCDEGDRHDVFAAGSDITVSAVSRDLFSVSLITTVPAGEAKSIDFAADILRLTAVGGTSTGEIRSFSNSD